MYHCCLKIYFIGIEKTIKEVIQSISPMEHFSHEFLESEKAEKELLSWADIVLMASHHVSIEEAVQISKQKQTHAEMVLLVEKEQMEQIKDYLLSFQDIWNLPMCQEEICFRFMRMQQKWALDKELWQTRNYLDTTINSIPDLVWYKDKEGVHKKVNESFCKAVNKTMQQIEGRGHYYIWDIEPEEYAKGEYICMESEYQVMEKKETCVFDENVKIGDSMRQLKTYKSPLFDIDGSVMGTVGVATDVTQERLYEQMIITSANTDFLTGLFNRRYIYQYIEENKGIPLTIYYLDLDNFKSINDVYGHQEGDRALILTTKVLQESMPEDVIARVGGDEFLIIKLGESNAKEVEEQRIRLQKELDEAYRKNEHFMKMSASIGTAYSEKDGIAIDTLIGEADALMYQEKNQKK